MSWGELWALSIVIAAFAALVGAAVARYRRGQ